MSIDRTAEKKGEEEEKLFLFLSFRPLPKLAGDEASTLR